MKIHQLSLFLENKPGHLIAPCRLLADAGINIRTLSLADTQQFGILRLIVRDWQRGQRRCSKRPAASSTSPRWWPSRCRTGPAAWPTCWSASKAPASTSSTCTPSPSAAATGPCSSSASTSPDAAIERLQAGRHQRGGQRAKCYDRIERMSRRTGDRRAAGARLLDPAHVRRRRAPEGRARRGERLRLHAGQPGRGAARAACWTRCAAWPRRAAPHSHGYMPNAGFPEVRAGRGATA